jgi:hypothetical protein
MLLCAQCADFSNSRSFKAPEGYLDFVRKLIEAVKNRSFVLIHADCPLEEMFNTPMPGDSIVHQFRCAACGRTYELYVNTWNGRNWWKSKQWPEQSVWVQS